MPDPITAPDALAVLTAILSRVPSKALDPEDGYRRHEAVCLRHSLTFNDHLPICPECKEAL